MKQNSWRSIIFKWIGALVLMAGALSLGGCKSGQAVRRLAVLDFENTITAPEFNHLSATMAEQLTDALINDTRVSMIDRRDVASTIASRGFGDLFHANPNKLKRLGRKLDANYLVLGSISRLAENFILKASLFSVETGESVPGTSYSKYCRREADLYPCIQSVARFVAYQAAGYRQRMQMAKNKAYQNDPARISVARPIQ